MTVHARHDDPTPKGATIRRPVALVVLAVSVLLLGASFLSTVQRTRESQRDALDARLGLAAADRTRTVQETFDRAAALIGVLARDPDLAGALAADASSADGRVAAERTLLDFQHLYDGTASEFCLITPAGQETARVVNGRVALATQLSDDESGADWFGPALALGPGGVHQAAPYWSPDTSEWVISSATAVRDDAGRPIGVVHFETTVNDLVDALDDDSGRLHAQLVDRTNGVVLADTRYPVVGVRELRASSRAQYPQLVGGPAAGTRSIGAERVAFRQVALGPDAVGGSGQDNANDWYVVVVSPAAVHGLFSGLDVSSLTMAGGALLLLALGGLTLRANQRRLRRAATSDGLTGLPNRNMLLEVAERELLAAQRTGTVMALLLLDLDRFKEINDTLGHQWGDRLLREVGPRLQPVLRHTDLIARLGGDEFVVLLRDVGGEETARRVGERIVRLLTEPFQLGDLSCGIEASIGIALGPRDGADVHELLQHADVAMYVAKENRFGVTVYEPGLDLHNPRKLSLLGELRVAIEQEQLELHYQPINALAAGARPGVEALLRWRHPERGLVPPDEFIPLAEHTALMQSITAYVLDRAVAQCRAWLDGGRTISMAVNISARSLHDPSFFDLVKGTLDRHGVAPELLDLEITESAIMVDPKGARDLLERLHDLGVRLSIDDFGTGYSSLAYLKTLPVHSLKIDRSFVRGLEADQSDAVIVQSVIDLGRNLGLSVVAEGVEDGPTADHLTRLGCTMGQGWFWSRAQPAAELADWVTATPVVPVGEEPVR